MSTHYDLQRLVITNIFVVESAPAIAQEIDTAIEHAISSRISEWVKEKKCWRESENPYDGLTFNAMQPEKWGVDEKNRFVSYYYIAGFTGTNGEDFNYNISALTRSSSYEMGIFFSVNEAKITGLSGKGGSRPGVAWRKFLVDKSHIPGFRIEDGSLFLPFTTVDAESLADSYPNLDPILSVVSEALSKLEYLHIEVDKLLEDAKKLFSE